MNNIAKHIFPLLLLTFFAACSSEDADKESVKEIPVEAIVATDLPEADLFSTAKKQYEQGLYSVAVRSFEALANAFPLGPYAEFARIKLGDCQYKLTSYEEAAVTFENFAKNYPSAKSRPYALLMAARSMQIDYNGVGTDTEPLERSKALYSSLITEYPDSIYANTAKVFRREAVATMAETELFIADYYKKRGNEKAYLARNTYFERTLGKTLTSPAPSALPEVLMANRNVPKNPDPESIPGNPANMRAQLSQQKALALLDEQASFDVGTKQQGRRTLLKKVSCRTSPAATLELTFSRPLTLKQEQAVITDTRRLQAREGILAITLPGIVMDTETRTCFRDADLALEENGMLRLSTNRDAVVFQLSNPPRLMLTLE